MPDVHGDIDALARVGEEGARRGGRAGDVGRDDDEERIGRERIERLAAERVALDQSERQGRARPARASAK